jgi:hypothetical protein
LSAKAAKTSCCPSGDHVRSGVTPLPKSCGALVKCVRACWFVPSAFITQTWSLVCGLGLMKAICSWLGDHAGEVSVTLSWVSTRSPVPFAATTAISPLPQSTGSGPQAPLTMQK